MNSNHRRVVITGVGILSPIGNGLPEFGQNLMQGKSGIARLKADFIEQLDTKIVGQVDFEGADHFSKQELALLDRVSQFALHCAEKALEDARLDISVVNKNRTGCFLGTGMGGASSTEEGYHRLFKEKANRLKPFTVLMAMNNAAASQIALRYQLGGPNFTYTTACSSSAIAIGEAYRQIAYGHCDYMLAGGSEALLTFGTIKAWEALRTLAKEDETNPAASCKPFSKNRTGLVLGEGCAVFILESYESAMQRNAPIHAEIVGYGTTNDYTHLTQPSIDGQSRAIQAALADADIAPSDIGYINAHGTGTLLNDVTETNAIKHVFGDYAYQVPISSTKSMHGHLMGAAGAIELAATMLALETCSLPPTMHLTEPDPECDLNYIPNQSIHNDKLLYAMSNSFAFGGTSGVLILKKV